MVFRLGLLGLDEWHNVDAMVTNFARALDRIGVVERVVEMAG